MLLAILATLFAAASILYTALWMYNTLWQFPVELGFDYQYLEAEHCDLVKSVQRRSSVESAGLRAGDRIVEINGRPIENFSSLAEVAMHHPGDAIKLTIQRANVPAPFVIESVLRAAHPFPKEERVALDVGRDIANTTPLAFLVVGLVVLFLRLEDPTAWLLALMFAGFIAIPGVPNSFAGLNPHLRAFALFYRALFNNMVTPLFYFFFAVFPTRSPLDRRIPWLKWIALMVGAFLAPPAVLGRFSSGRHVILLVFLYGLIALSFVSLIWNAFSAPTPEARRKIRVILWGTLVGVVPAMLVLGSNDFFGFHQPPLIFVAAILLLWLFPLSFAYAVVKHQVLEIPVLLRRSARYLLVQRGFTVLLSLLSVGVVWVFALSFARYLDPLTGTAVPGGIALGTAFGSLLFWIGTRVRKRVGERIDQAFFRSAYDARMILEDLAEKTRTATDREELATLLDYHLNQALQPSSLAVYLETRDHQISAMRYATLFFADYDDSSGRLRYVNCGHWPPLLLRTHGQLQRLSATATVLGLFEEWECSAAEVQFAAGDTLVLYTDGVTEAENVQDEQFGESRLIETMLAQRHLPVPSLLETIVEAVQKFSEGEQADDITLVLAKCGS